MMVTGSQYIWESHHNRLIRIVTILFNYLVNVSKPVSTTINLHYSTTTFTTFTTFFTSKPHPQLHPSQLHTHVVDTHTKAPNKLLLGFFLLLQLFATFSFIDYNTFFPIISGSRPLSNSKVLDIIGKSNSNNQSKRLEITFC